MIGRTDARDSNEVLRALRGIRNVEVVPDADGRTKEEYYRHASIYLHLKPNEHFGIAVLDAVATATIPIMPRSGGHWMDILEEEKYCLGFEGITEIPGLIDKAEKLIDKEKVYRSREFQLSNLYKKSPGTTG